MKPLYLAGFLVAGISIYLPAIRPNTEGAVYRVSIAQARQALTTAELPPLVFGSEPPDVQVRDTGNSQIVWIARREGEELFRYTAQLKAEGDGATRVKVKLEGAQGRTVNFAQKLAEHPEIRNMYLIAMEEQVARTSAIRDHTRLPCDDRRHGCEYGRLAVFVGPGRRSFRAGCPQEH
jgi:hypothetical protein